MERVREKANGYGYCLAVNKVFRFAYSFIVYCVWRSEVRLTGSHNCPSFTIRADVCSFVWIYRRLDLI